MCKRRWSVTGPDDDVFSPPGPLLLLLLGLRTFDEVCLLFPVRRDVQDLTMDDVHGEDRVFCADDETGVALISVGDEMKRWIDEV